MSDDLVLGKTTGNEAVHKIIGIHFEVKPGFEEEWSAEKLREEHPDADITEVVIVGRGQTKTLTFEEFFSRLGFE